MSEYPKAEIGVFGGSGFYELLDNPREFKVNTPYGAPVVGTDGGRDRGRSVAFLPRHGKDHSLPPHKINYRANLWAMKELGVAADHRSQRLWLVCSQRSSRGIS